MTIANFLFFLEFDGNKTAKQPFAPLIKVKDEFISTISELREVERTRRIPTPPFLRISSQFSMAATSFKQNLHSLRQFHQSAAPSLMQFELALPRGNNIIYKGFRYYRDGANIYKKTQQLRIYWRCTNIPGKCRARVHTDPHFYVVKVVGDHESSCHVISPSNLSR